jgi:putative alpha-1,2-mannosidase
LFNYSGKPWLTQKWVRTICDQFYGTTPMHGYGIGQDEDQGQLGAWYVIASMGLFDVQGHTAARPTFQFGSPLFDKIVIELDQDYYEGQKLVISTERTNPDDTYIQSVTWNGAVIENNWIYRDELMQGGELHFMLGSEPNYARGSTPSPPSMHDEK